VDDPIRLVVGLFVAVLIAALIVFARGEPSHGEPTAQPAAAVVSIA
jgi:hypothetical protein